MNNGDLFFLNISESVEIPEYKDEGLNPEKRKLLDILTKNHTFNFQRNTILLSGNAGYIGDMSPDDNDLKEKLQSEICCK